MNSALLHNGKVVMAHEYNEEIHGSRLYCIDSSCKASVIFVPGTETMNPYFKTTGKSESSKHTETCGFYKPLTFEESVSKVKQYQEEYLETQSIRENVIRINLNSIDPDHEPTSKEREKSQKKEPAEIKLKNESQTPLSITSLKSIVNLLTSYEPDILASILVTFKGSKIPLSQIILSQHQAHELLWNDELNNKLSYFVYGTIEKVYRREKVYYINFKPINNIFFSLVVFDKYFKYFTYTDEQLIGKKVLAWGYLRKNTFQDKNTSEMIIKSNKYIHFIS